MKVFLILFFIAVSLQVTSQKLYQINVPVGFSLKAKSIMNMEMSMNEKEKPMTSVTTSYFRLIATKVNEDNVEFNMIIDSIFMEVTDKGKTTKANSNIPSSYQDNEKLSGTFEVIGKVMKVKIAKNGKLIKEEFTPQMAEYCVLQFSDNPVNVREAWETEQEDESSGIKITTKVKNMIESINNDGLMNIRSESENAMFGPEPVLAHMYADEKTGLLKKYEFSVTMKMFGTMKMAVRYEANW